MGKLIRIKDDHFIIVDDSEINEKLGEFFYSFETNKIYSTISHNTAVSCKKVTHSTEPLDKTLFFTDRIWGCEKLSLGDVKEIIGDYDNSTKFRRSVKNTRYEMLSASSEVGDGVILGYNKCLEDNKDKKFTEEDMVLFATEVILYGKLGKLDIDKLISSYCQPKTMWEVEFDKDGKLIDKL